MLFLTQDFKVIFASALYPFEISGPQDEGQHAHTHGHTHRHTLRQGRPPQPVDWKVLLGSAAFVVILFLRLMVDHILGKEKLQAKAKRKLS